MVIAETTREPERVASRSSASWLEMSFVISSVSAAVPAPQQ